MSLIYNRDLNFNGTSQTTVEKENEMPVTIMSMSANYNTSGISFSKFIPDIEVFKANKDVTDADFADFESKVYEALGIALSEATETK